MARLQQRLKEAENQPTNSCNEERRKELKLTGSVHMMEFLKELTEYKEKYYEEN